MALFSKKSLRNHNVWGCSNRYTGVLKWQQFIDGNINKFFRDSEFPNILKYAEVIPINEKKDHLDE